MAVLDRALTTPVKARELIGRWSETTAKSYIDEWQKYEAWARSEGWTPMPCTPETFARYTTNLVRQSKAPATIRKAQAAIRAWHRLHGQPVPDGVPALAVLQDHDRTLRAGGWEPRRAEALTVAEALRILAAVDRATVRGRRDACILMLAYGGMLTPQQLVALRIRDVAATAAGLTVHRGPGDDLAVPHWHTAGEHRPEVCPVEAVDAWTRYLRGRDADPAGPLIRPIADGGRVAGLDPFSGVVAGNGSLAAAGLGPILSTMLERAGVADPSRYTMRSLRIGGIARRRLDGLTVDQLADESGLSTIRSTLLDYVRTAEQWQIDSTMDDR